MVPSPCRLSTAHTAISLPSSPAPIGPPKAEWRKSCASQAPNPGRHHVGTLGDIISECLGDFIGIGMQRKQGPIRPCKYKSALRGGRRFSQALEGLRHWPRNRLLYEHRFRSSGNLVVSNLDRIAEVDDVGNERPRQALYLLAPVTVCKDRRERCHLGLTLGPIKSLVLDEI